MIGSSPRVWGQGYLIWGSGTISRIIPTRVGTSHFRFIVCPLRRDHPHACGDKQKAVKFLRWATGSSPRVWGQDTVFTSYPNVIRIIPTRVGTSYSCFCTWSTIWDHPHACGDKAISMPFGFAVVGSSPRVWGQEGLYSEQSEIPGIIPTRVGTSAVIDRSCSYDEDHPHACGDKYNTCW